MRFEPQQRGGVICERILEEREGVGDRDEQRVPRHDGLARDEVARLAKAGDDLLVREHGEGEGSLSDAARSQDSDACCEGR